MEASKYKILTDALMDKAMDIEESKRPAYTVGSADVLANFKRIGRETDSTASKIALIYLLKQIDSIRSLVRGGLKDPEPPLTRFADSINYLRLLYACLYEEGQDLDNGTTTNGEANV